jgi:FdhD protein
MGGREEVRDRVAVEEPMEIRLRIAGPEGTAVLPVAVTMRTPGDDVELAAGFLFGEGILSGREAVARIAHCPGEGPQELNVVQVSLRPGVTVDPTLLTRNFTTTSSCGVCGKASLDAVEVRGGRPFEEPEPILDPAEVAALPDRLRESQAVFQRTGGLHAAGLFDAGSRLLDAREDVGRHNAVDKVVGRALLDGRLPLDRRVLVVSGRTSFEIVQKALAARIPVVVAVGAPSSLAVDLARRFGQTLVGFARDGGFNVYAGRERIDS